MVALIQPLLNYHYQLLQQSVEPYVGSFFTGVPASDSVTPPCREFNSSSDKYPTSKKPFVSIIIFIINFPPFTLRGCLYLYSSVWTITYHSSQLCCHTQNIVIINSWFLIQRMIRFSLLWSYNSRSKQTFQRQETLLSKFVTRWHLQREYLQPIITQYFIDNKSEIWLLFLIAHSKRWRFNAFIDY